MGNKESRSKPKWSAKLSLLRKNAEGGRGGEKEKDAPAKQTKEGKPQLELEAVQILRSDAVSLDEKQQDQAPADKKEKETQQAGRLEGACSMEVEESNAPMPESKKSDSWKPADKSPAPTEGESGTASW